MLEPTVFLSYHRADLAAAERVRAHLLFQRCATWMDRYDIPPGAYWPEEIDRGLQSADVVLGLLSPDSVASRNVKNEWDWAIENDKRLVLLQVHPCVLPHRYVSINFIDATEPNFAAALDHLVRTVGLEAKPADLPVPQTRYARSGDVSIAYQTFGEGPIDLVQVPGFVSHVELSWSQPGFAALLRRLGSLARVIVFDKRGTGLSDRVAGIATLEERMDDVRAVMDANGVGKAVIWGWSEGVPLSTLFAATYPERTSALVLYGGSASYVRRPDYPWRPPFEQALQNIERTKQTLYATWGTLAHAREVLELMAPSAVDDAALAEWTADLMRLGCSPGAAIALDRMNLEIDVRAVLPTIRDPTLVVYRTGDRVRIAPENAYLADHIPGATRTEFPGDDHSTFVGDFEPILDAIEHFIATAVQASDVTEEPETTLATIVSIFGDEFGRDRLSAIAQR
jgi:pimeloyl-ACP methyl ester carboxylesterase